MRWDEYLKKERLPSFWCAGCGYGQVMRSLAMALEKTRAALENTVIVSGIGCWGHVDSWMKPNAFHGIHGRALAFATGIKLASPALNVIVVMGDGDGVTIGGNHFIHACRRNVGLTAVVCNNLNYGMTGGQYSGTTPEDSITSTSRYGHIEQSFDICRLAEAAGAHFIARSISENVVATADCIAEGMKRENFAVIEVMSPCTTHYGRNNNMRKPIEMYRRIKSLAVPVGTAAKLSSEQMEGKFVTGILLDRPGEDYFTRYQNNIKVKAQTAAKEEGT
ncbi:MAG: 2-oxoacid:ferredoxin oxidoreductase subunit beta [Clostridiales Family XIII bacterium]|jgi:2-oxoglutarate ferredoxin oxidoreductase subunit beta|nr:2-oxoacid:ferredoxin oxidoreductase subunit beta [Clostridiales Family XIII bacterium]